MIMYLPLSILINGIDYTIREKCEHRMVLKTIRILKDSDLDEQSKIKLALYNFYQTIYDKVNETEDLDGTLAKWRMTDNEIPFIESMYKIIGVVDDETPKENNIVVMDWEHDYDMIVTEVNKILHYDTRDKNIYTHWFTFVSAYRAIDPDSYYGQILQYRIRKKHGKKQSEYDREFYKYNKQAIDLPIKLDSKEQEWLDSDW